MITYLYAVGRDLTVLPGRSPEGIGGGAVRVVREAGLQAVVSDVAQDAFDDLDRRREDLAWLATLARTHHGVVEAVGREHAVAPLALATVYLDDDRVRAVLREGRAGFVAVLDRVTGREEWGVKAFARAASASPTERPTSGAAYLRARRAALRAGEASLTAAEQAAEEVDAALSALAVAARRHAPQHRSLSGRSEAMVLNGAYLVDRSAAEGFRAQVAELAAAGSLALDLTGPWVPYSFAGGGR